MLPVWLRLGMLPPKSTQHPTLPSAPMYVPVQGPGSAVATLAVQWCVRPRALHRAFLQCPPPPPAPPHTQYLHTPCSALTPSFPFDCAYVPAGTGFSRCCAPCAVVCQTPSLSPQCLACWPVQLLCVPLLYQHCPMCPLWQRGWLLRVLK